MTMSNAERALKLVTVKGPPPSSPEGTLQSRMPDIPLVKPEAVEADGLMSEMWDQVVPSLIAAGQVTAADSLGLEMALRHYKAAVEASEVLYSMGPLGRNAKDEWVRNPVDMIFRGNSEQFLKYAMQFGLTTTARLRTRIPDSEADGDGGDNPFA